MQLQASSPEGRGPSQELAAAAAVAMVLGNDDLLIDILLRLDFPTWLVRAAAVCRRWLSHASDLDFLRRFRALHPPCIFGLQVQGGGSPLRFLQVPQRPRARGRHPPRLRDPRPVRARHRLPQRPHHRRDLRRLPRPLRAKPAASDARRPLHPKPTFWNLYLNLGAGGNERYGSNEMFLLEDQDASFLSLETATNGENVHAMFSILQSGAWSVPRSAVLDLNMVTGEEWPHYQIVGGKKFVVDRKVYMLSAVSSAGHMFGLDLVTSSFFTVKLPDGVGSYKLSRAQHSGLCIIDAMGFQLRVWYGDGLGQWVLEDTICVREACGHLNVQKWKPDGDLAPVLVVGVGDNAEFAFLKLVASGVVCCLELGKRIVEKMEWTVPDVADTVTIPMVWPPILPVLGEAANKEH